MGVYSTGNSYGVPDDLIYSFPVTIKVSGKSIEDIIFFFIRGVSVSRKDEIINVHLTFSTYDQLLQFRIYDFI